jgi:Family of unknown function (DUF6335)
MSDNRKPEKQETDANDLIRDYEESPAMEAEGIEGIDDENQTTMEWYEQARQDTAVPPDAELTGGDIDAAWDQAAGGEETVGGSNPTPDQDLVDEIGRAVGVDYEDAEPLDMTGKVERRDEQRWELHPASSEDFAARNESYDVEPPKPGSQSERPASAEKSKRKAA